MGPTERPLAEEFAAPDLTAWRALVDKTLKGADFERRLVSRTRDGLAIQPLYTPADGPPEAGARRAPPSDVQRPWDLRALVDHPDRDRANREVLGDLRNGAASVLVRLDPSGVSGVAVASQDDLAAVLDGVLLDLAPVALEAGLMGPQAANWLAVLAKGAPEAPLAFHLDPFSAFAETGVSPGPIEAHLISAAQTAARHALAYPKASLFLATGRTVHEAGGAAPDELAFMAAAAVAYAKAMVRAGLSLEEAFARLVLGVVVDADDFTSIAKLRAARALWARLTGACGVTAAARIEARASRRMLSRLDPWVNLLRLTAAGFAGGVGGADAVVLEPFTRPLGQATDFARRQARNAQLVLMEEAHLGRVADPAGGSWFLERLTDDLARLAWDAFRRIVAEGGLIAALESGSIARATAAVCEARRADIATRRSGLVGVSEFPNLGEAAVAVDPVDPAPLARRIDLRLPGPDSRCEPLVPMRLSEPFEALRARAPAGDKAPSVFLAVLGAPAEYAARVSFSRNLLAAGGVRAIDGDLADYGPATSPLAVICGSDEAYGCHAAAAARMLKAGGAHAVWLAGRPGALEAELKAAGVDDYLYAGADVTAILSKTLEILR